MMQRAANQKPPNFASRLRRSLSAKLLLLTIGFVLAAELILLIPSVSKERVDWLEARIEAAYLVSLALEAPEAEMLKPEDVDRLFATANILGVIVDREGTTRQIFARAVDYENPPPIRFVELGGASPPDLVVAAWSMPGHTRYRRSTTAEGALMKARFIALPLAFAAAAAVWRAWLDCSAPNVMTAWHSLRRASPIRNSSLRVLLPPVASPVQSSRFT